MDVWRYTGVLVVVRFFLFLEKTFGESAASLAMDDQARESNNFDDRLAVFRVCFED